MIRNSLYVLLGILLGVILSYIMFVKIIFFDYECYDDGCYCVDGIETKYLIDGLFPIQSTHYCNLLRGSLKGNETDIKEFTLINLNGGYAYYHGGVILDLIDRIGEDKFINAISSCNLNELRLIELYLHAGIEYYRDYSCDNGNAECLKEHYPKIWLYLNHQINNITTVY